MKLFGFIVGLFTDHKTSEKLEVVEEAAKRDAQLVVSTYTGAFAMEVSRLLADGQQQMLSHEHVEPGDEIFDTVIVPTVPEETPEESEWDYSGMSWTELRAEAKEQGVKFTPKTTREELTRMLK